MLGAANYDRFKLLLAGGAGLEPEQVGVGRGGCGKGGILLFIYRAVADGGIDPHFYFGVSVSKRQHAALAVITGGKVGPGAGLAHVDAEEAVVDGIGVFIDE